MSTALSQSGTLSDSIRSHRSLISSTCKSTILGPAKVSVAFVHQLVMFGQRNAQMLNSVSLAGRFLITLISSGTPSGTFTVFSGKNIGGWSPVSDTIPTPIQCAAVSLPGANFPLVCVQSHLHRQVTGKRGETSHLLAYDVWLRLAHCWLQL